MLLKPEELSLAPLINESEDIETFMKSLTNIASISGSAGIKDLSPVASTLSVPPISESKEDLDKYVFEDTYAVGSTPVLEVIERKDIFSSQYLPKDHHNFLGIAKEACECVVSIQTPTIQKYSGINDFLDYEYYPSLLFDKNGMEEFLICKQSLKKSEKFHQSLEAYLNKHSHSNYSFYHVKGSDLDNAIQSITQKFFEPVKKMKVGVVCYKPQKNKHKKPDNKENIQDVLKYSPPMDSKFWKFLGGISENMKSIGSLSSLDDMANYIPNYRTEWKDIEIDFNVASLLSDDAFRRTFATENCWIVFVDKSTMKEKSLSKSSKGSSSSSSSSNSSSTYLFNPNDFEGISHHVQMFLVVEPVDIEIKECTDDHHHGYNVNDESNGRSKSSKTTNTSIEGYKMYFVRNHEFPSYRPHSPPTQHYFYHCNHRYNDNSKSYTPNYKNINDINDKSTSSSTASTTSSSSSIDEEDKNCSPTKLIENLHFVNCISYMRDYIFTKLYNTVTISTMNSLTNKILSGQILSELKHLGIKFPKKLKSKPRSQSNAVEVLQDSKKKFSRNSLGTKSRSRVQTHTKKPSETATSSPDFVGAMMKSKMSSSGSLNEAALTSAQKNNTKLEDQSVQQPQKSISKIEKLLGEKVVSAPNLSNTGISGGLPDLIIEEDSPLKDIQPQKNISKLERMLGEKIGSPTLSAKNSFNGDIQVNTVPDFSKKKSTNALTSSSPGSSPSRPSSNSASPLNMSAPSTPQHPSPSISPNSSTSTSPVPPHREKKSSLKDKLKKLDLVKDKLKRNSTREEKSSSSNVDPDKSPNTNTNTNTNSNSNTNTSSNNMNNNTHLVDGSSNNNVDSDSSTTPMSPKQSRRGNKKKTKSLGLLNNAVVVASNMSPSQCGSAESSSEEVNGVIESKGIITKKDSKKIKLAIFSQEDKDTTTTASTTPSKQQQPQNIPTIKTTTTQDENLPTLKISHSDDHPSESTNTVPSFESTPSTTSLSGAGSSTIDTIEDMIENYEGKSVWFIVSQDTGVSVSHIEAHPYLMLKKSSRYYVETPTSQHENPIQWLTSSLSPIQLTRPYSYYFHPYPHVNYLGYRDKTCICVVTVSKTPQTIIKPINHSLYGDKELINITNPSINRHQQLLYSSSLSNRVFKFGDLYNAMMINEQGTTSFALSSDVLHRLSSSKETSNAVMETLNNLSKDISFSLMEGGDFDESLIQFEKKHTMDLNYFHVAVLYALPGQRKFKSILKNKPPSNKNSSFFKWLEHMGKKVNLKTWEQYRGSLGKIEELDAYYSYWNDVQIIYHIAPFMTKEQRRRLIGNDIVYIIYYDHTQDPVSDVDDHDEDSDGTVSVMGDDEDEAGDACSRSNQGEPTRTSSSTEKVSIQSNIDEPLPMLYTNRSSFTPFDLNILDGAGQIGQVFVFLLPDESITDKFRVVFAQRPSIITHQPPQPPYDFLFSIPNYTLKPFLLAKLHNAMISSLSSAPLNRQYTQPRAAALKALGSS
eukprot:TRINITY_DN2123_c1_g1_i6.p1 TRINITY_DN2123_c1_g1~~TRINITY_DN2123_c1_g1_i6.p1  ORF type:complete len:1490 (-),score=456.26 TRINITY_DN2123_c1_g1_i6:218-4687(-)